MLTTLYIDFSDAKGQLTLQSLVRFGRISNSSVLTGPVGSVVEHPLREQEVVGSNPGRAIPKAFKMVPVATLLGVQH